ncbi:MAG: hypothetical protein K0B07_00575 [DPANN group archaeon]|nr:hypothetical protein [DPANN group archaeon]
MSTIGLNTEAKIISKLNDKPCSVSQLAQDLKIRRDFLAGFLEAMRLTGKLEVIDVGRAKVYRPIKEVQKQ